jgi:translation initiation factor 2 subunit 1
VGRNECVVVIRVDENKGYIDLSKRRVITKDLVQCEERYAKAKAVNSILRHVADKIGYDTNEQLEDLYEKTAWYFDRLHRRKTAAYDMFKKAIQEPSVLDECQISDEIKQVLLEDIKKRLTPTAVKIRADIQVSCFTYDGIDAVKAALNEGFKCSTEEMPIKINLIAPPDYVLVANTFERAEGLAAVGAAVEKIKVAIEQAGGEFKQEHAPRVVSDQEHEEQMRKRMEELGLNDNDLQEGEEDNDEGMVAPKGLDEQADAQGPIAANDDDDSD